MTPDASPAVPCVVCGTTQGSRRSNGQYIRYRGARYGQPGLLCSTCRARLIRHQLALALGFQPGQAGRRPGTAQVRRRADAPAPTPAPPKHPKITPEQVAENLKQVRRECELAGRCPSIGESEQERTQRYWAELAARERHQAAPSPGVLRR